MKITIENTSKIVVCNESACRVWEGQTESGIPVHVFIVRLAPTIPFDDPRQQEFIEALEECKAPSAAIQSYPLRMIL